jgi:molybdopterin adenylyltransferase
MKVAILTVSTSAARGERTDRSGEAIAGWARSRGYNVAAHTLVPDDTVAIVRQLLEWCDTDVAELVLTTGGTGLSPTDVTPEATMAVIEREAPGMAELLRGRASRGVPRAALSRGVCGTRNRTVILNLPGSPSGVLDGLTALEAVVDHAVSVARGEVATHDPAGGQERSGGAPKRAASKPASGSPRGKGKPGPKRR